MTLWLGIFVLAVFVGPSAARAHEPGKGCDFARYKPIRIGHLAPDCVVKRVEPVYPQMGNHLNITGTVTVTVVISRSGDVVAACAVSGHPLLRSSAINAVRQWRFDRNFCFIAAHKRRYVEATMEFSFEGPRPGAAPPN